MSSKLKFADQVFDSLAELNEYQFENNIIERTDGWQNKVNKENQKIYNAKEFIIDAKMYFGLTPPNLLQSASKLWFAASYAVKEYFAGLYVHVNSHDGMSFLANMAILTADKPTAVRLTRAWDFAQELHRFTYGSTILDYDEFKRRKEEVEYFVETFPKIQLDPVKAAFHDEIAKPAQTNDRITIRQQYKFMSATIGDKGYEYEYVVT